MNLELLKKLSLTPGPSGREDEVRSILKKLIKPFVDDLYVDKYGNLICHKRGVGPKALLAAHMDEIGLMVKGIDANGDLRCSPIGGIDAINMIGERAALTTKKGVIYGVITTSALSNAEVVDTVPQLKDLIVDTGLSKDELIRWGVEPGDYLNLDRYFMTLGSSKIVSGKALDDRIGCYILLELAKKLKKSKQEVFYVFTVQEEVGLYGAKTSIYGMDPDYAIIVDVTSADDKSVSSTRVLGKGPCLTIKDADMLSNRCIDDWVRAAGRRKKISLQMDISDEGTTDALTISIAKGGIPTTVVGVAVRNLHTTIGIAHTDDVDECITVLEETVRNPDMKCFPT
ncbi:MAG TPA: M28 family peptidase [Candidatus Nanoarchaeia archaeon]|nr:M28 family peptidase [Candidatus Nanoarchaeia archaeon]